LSTKQHFITPDFMRTIVSDGPSVSGRTVGPLYHRALTILSKFILNLTMTVKYAYES